MKRITQRHMRRQLQLKLAHGTRLSKMASMDADQLEAAVRIVFSTAVLTRYRIPFHEGVRNRLNSWGIAYDILFGKPDAKYPADSDEGNKAGLAPLSWGKPVANRYFHLGHRSVLWQPVLREIWASDLVVIGQ